MNLTSIKIKLTRANAIYSRWFSKIRPTLLVSILAVGCIVAGFITGCSILFGQVFENTNPSEFDISWEPNGQLLALNGDTLRLFATSLEEIQVLENNVPEATSIDWSADGTRLVQAGCEIQIWNRITRQTIVNAPQNGCLSSVSWSRVIDRIATGAADNKVSIWSADTLELILSLNNDSNQINTVAWNPQNTSLASGDTNGTVKIWDGETGELINSLQVAMNVYTISWSPDGNLLAIGGNNTEIQIWDIDKGQLRSTLPAAETPFWVSSVEWHPDGTQLVSASSKIIHIWDSTTGQLIRTLEGHNGTVNDVAWRPSGDLLASVSTDKTIRLWNVLQGQVAIGEW